MRITKVYTKIGDKGQTALVGGDMVSKSHERIEAYGTVDELNAVLGLVQSFLSNSGLSEEEQADFAISLHRIQNHLFNIGADLATPKEHRWENMIRVGNTDIDWLEQCIDSLNDTLPPLTEFILPGGSHLSAFLHQGRTVCRRAERCCTRLTEAEQIDLGPLQYLNRLSDYLFVASRWVNQKENHKEEMWQKSSK